MVLAHGRPLGRRLDALSRQSKGPGGERRVDGFVSAWFRGEAAGTLRPAPWFFPVVQASGKPAWGRPRH